MMGFGMGFGGLGILFMLVFWVVVIGLGVWLLANLFPKISANTSPQNSPDSPVEILKRRYARGEISREEYERMRQELEQ
ncbi:MAG: hypothetical protein D6706_10495 [Chloroflexi bacterium]|nr:MAG: hypothetical protein D6706_10495 [Chloroflexota bacterium]